MLSNTAVLADFIYSSPFGLLALFLFAVIANASVFFPILVEPVIFAVCAFAPNPFIVLVIGVTIGIASGIGEMSGYILGLFGVKTLQKFNEKRVEKIFEMGEKLATSGMPIIILGAFTPFPFDLIGIAAGIIKYDAKRFFIAATIGKVMRYSLIAFAGFYGMAWVSTWFML